jgi:hypothetical protein
MVPATVLAETCYLIDKTLGPPAEAAFLDSVGAGPDHTFSWPNSSIPTCAGCQPWSASTRPPTWRHGRLGGRRLRATRHRHRVDNADSALPENGSPRVM